MVTRQLVQYFGEQAAHYLQYWDAVWLNETIGMDEKQLTLSPHQNNGDALFTKGYLGNKLWWAGTETAQNYGGYMDGAIESGLCAANAANRIGAINKTT